jgi:hypothetical protein
VAGVAAGVLALVLRLAAASAVAVRLLEASALLAAAAAYLVHLAGTARTARDRALRSGLALAFVLWAAAQAFPEAAAAPFLNDGAIVLFVADLALMLHPWSDAGA